MRAVKDDKKAGNAQTADDNADGIKIFFSEIGAIKETVALIKNSIAEIKSLHDRALNSVISEQENARN
jgi:syntaxin 1A/syntaxin 1B/2/3